MEQAVGSSHCLPDRPPPFDLIDHSAYFVASTRQYGDSGPTYGALIDAETGGMLVLPVAGTAAASGQWVDPPRWPIPGVTTEDVTEEIKALEPQWTGGPLPPEEALAEVLLGDDTGDDECGPLARSFPDTSIGDGAMYIELRTYCDDSVAGVLYEVYSAAPDGSFTAGANRRVLCWRGVTADGLCV